MKQFPLIAAAISIAIFSGCASNKAELETDAMAEQKKADMALEKARILEERLAEEKAAKAPFILIDVPQVSDRRSAFDPKDSRPLVEPEYDADTEETFAAPFTREEEQQMAQTKAQAVSALNPVYAPFPQAHRRQPQPNTRANIQPDPTATGAAADLRIQYGQLAADVATAQFCQSHAYRNRARDRLVTQSQIDASKESSGSELSSAAGAFHGYVIGVRAAFNHYNAYLDNGARDKMCASAASSVQKRLLSRKPRGSNKVSAEDVRTGKEALNSLPSSSSGLYPAHIAVAYSCAPNNSQNKTALGSIQGELLSNLTASLNDLQASPAARQWAKAAALGQFRGIADAKNYYSSGQDPAGNKAMCEKAQGYVASYLSHAK